jgi:hypothetical protein
LSHLLVCATELKDLSAVVRALRRMGLTEGTDFQVSADQRLTHTAYNKAVTDQMSLLIPKNTHHGYGDVGLKRRGENFVIYVDDIDIRRSLPSLVVHRGVDKNIRESGFTDRLLQWYGVVCAEDTLRAEGLSPTTVEDSDGRMRVTASY